MRNNIGFASKINSSVEEYLYFDSVISYCCDAKGNNEITFNRAKNNYDKSRKINISIENIRKEIKKDFQPLYKYFKMKETKGKPRYYINNIPNIIVNLAFYYLENSNNKDSNKNYYKFDLEIAKRLCKDERIDLQELMLFEKETNILLCLAISINISRIFILKDRYSFVDEIVRTLLKISRLPNSIRNYKLAIDLIEYYFICGIRVSTLVEFEDNVNKVINYIEYNIESSRNQFNNKLINQLNSSGYKQEEIKEMLIEKLSMKEIIIYINESRRRKDEENYNIDLKESSILNLLMLIDDSVLKLKIEILKKIESLNEKTLENLYNFFIRTINEQIIESREIVIRKQSDEIEKFLFDNLFGKYNIVKYNENYVGDYDRVKMNRIGERFNLIINKIVGYNNKNKNEKAYLRACLIQVILETADLLKDENVKININQQLKDKLCSKKINENIIDDIIYICRELNEDKIYDKSLLSKPEDKLSEKEKKAIIDNSNRNILRYLENNNYDKNCKQLSIYSKYSKSKSKESNDIKRFINAINKMEEELYSQLEYNNNINDIYCMVKNIIISKK